MFKRDDVIQLLRTLPFQPFRIHMTNGEAYDIRHPDMAVPSIEWIHVARSPADNPDGFERIVILSLSQVVKLETYPRQQTPANGVAG